MSFARGQYSIADAPVEERSAFIVRTYVHLLGAVLAFAAIEGLLFVVKVDGVSLAELFFAQLYGYGRAGMLVMMVAFMGTGMLADRWARGGSSPALQYTALALYVTMQALFIAPMLGYAALVLGSASIIAEAAVSTVVLFGCLTAVVFITRKDFSFMRGILMVGSVAALGLIVASLIFGFSLGLAFSWAMVALACGFILYETSGVLMHYRTGEHVAAALALFSSIATLFFYILRILLASRRN